MEPLNSGVGDAEFAALMAPLGPFGRAPAIAAGVSGGPHSLALALLAADWAAAGGGSLLALIADHGLRPESHAESNAVGAMLAAQGITFRILRLGLTPGPRMQERAREARLAALLGACAEAGRPWLLLGHHRADQAETLLFRALRGSGDAGLAAIAPVRAAPEALILRPLLSVEPTRLEAVCAARGLAPVRDPSNTDLRFARIRLRAALADTEGGPALALAAQAFAARRVRQDRDVACRLAVAAEFRPEGFARVDPKALGSDEVAVLALARLIRVVSGARHAPSRAATRDLLAAGRGTLGGAWLRPGAGGQWMLLRDPGAQPKDAPERRDCRWDGRFRLREAVVDGLRLDRPSQEEANLFKDLPAVIRTSLPVLRDPHGKLAMAASGGYRDPKSCFFFTPRGGAAT